MYQAKDPKKTEVFKIRKEKEAEVEPEKKFKQMAQAVSMKLKLGRRADFRYLTHLSESRGTKFTGKGRKKIFVGVSPADPLFEEQICKTIFTLSNTIRRHFVTKVYFPEF